MTDVILCAASNLFRMYVIGRFMKVLLGEPRVSRGTLLSGVCDACAAKEADHGGK